MLRGSSSCHPWTAAKSVHRVGKVGRPKCRGRSTEVAGSVDRKAQVGRPRYPQSVDRVVRVGRPKSPRGSGGRPQKVARAIYRLRQADRTSRSQSIDRPPHTRYNDSTPFDISTRPESIERPAPCRYIDMHHRYGRHNKTRRAVRRLPLPFGISIHRLSYNRRWKYGNGSSTISTEGVWKNGNTANSRV